MSDRTLTIHEMLRRAFQTQIDLGVGEMIVSQSVKELDFSSKPDITTAIPTRMSEGMTTIMTKTEISPQYSSLEEHRKAICECQACPLGKTRTKFVYGVGNTKADLMFIGEAPGAREDELGEPFVGRAGQLLDKIVEAMSLSRDQVFIANILKCRPPGNRDPQPDEMAHCFPYLKEQIRLLQPKVICALGRIAAQALLDTKTPLGKLRGVWHQYEGTELLVTYHPAALLRFASYKKDTWEDMQIIMKRMNLKPKPKAQA